jgi:hypothetical protein
MQQMKTFWVCAGRFGPDWCADWLLHHEALQVYMQWGATHLSMSSFVFCLIWSLNAKILTLFLNLFSLCHYLCMCCILASGIVLLKLCTDDVFNCRDSTTLSMKQQYWNMFFDFVGGSHLGHRHWVICALWGLAVWLGPNNIFCEIFKFACGKQ